MRKRKCRVVVYFTKDELEALTKKVRKSGLSREAFLRRMANDVQIKEGPDADVGRLIMEMRRVGANVNQTLKNMNASGVLDMPKFRQNMDDLRAATKLVVDTYAPEES